MRTQLECLAARQPTPNSEELVDLPRREVELLGAELLNRLVTNDGEDGRLGQAEQRIADVVEGLGDLGDAPFDQGDGFCGFAADPLSLPIHELLGAFRERGRDDTLLRYLSDLHHSRILSCL